MQIMDINLILELIKLLALVGLYVSLYIIIKSNLEKRNNLKYMELENRKFELYSQIDPKSVETEIDQFIEKYMDEYILKKYIVKYIDYIKKDEIEKMIRDLDTVICLEISDLYVYYIKLLTSIKDEDDLIRYIDRKVKEHVLGFVTQFNKPKEE